MYDIKGRIAVVTGASAGIGAACVRRLSAEGAKVIMIARRKERLEELSSDLAGPSLAIDLDITNQKAVQAAIDSLGAEWRDIDILVNNAGLGRGLDKLHEGSIDGWEEMIDTNVKGLLYMTRAIVPGMVERGRGHVINIGSIAGRQVYPGGNVYCATKHAVRALTEGLRQDLVDTAVRVTSVDPGLVETEFSQVRFYGDTERAKQTYVGYTPLAGEDIADAVYWVASRPEHVQVGDMTIFPSAQASAMVVHKRT